jgi:hypothetical protein
MSSSLSQVQYVTISTKDKNYLKVLKTGYLGTQKLVLLKSFCLNTSDEHSTFKVISSNENINKTLIKIIVLMEIKNLLFLLVPLISIYLAVIGQGAGGAKQLVVTAASLVFLYIATIFYSSYIDFVSGKDRGVIKEQKTSILSLKLNPHLIYQLAHVSLLFSLIFGSLVLNSHKSQTYVISLVTVFVISIFVFSRGWIKKYLKIITLFLCCGPLLTLGLSFLWQGQGVLSISWVLVLGSIHGAFALNYFLVSDFKNIMLTHRDDKSSVVNLVGFDNSKKIISYFIMIMFLLPIGLFFINNLSTLVICALVGLAAVFYLLLGQSYLLVHRIASPLTMKFDDLLISSWLLYLVSSISLWILIF